MDNKELEKENKLFDAHMNTMFDLVDALCEREELTEAEQAFLDAFLSYMNFGDKQESDEPRFLLDMDSICYGCHYFAGEDVECETPQPCVEGNMNGYRMDR